MFKEFVLDRPETANWRIKISASSSRNKIKLRWEPSASNDRFGSDIILTEPEVSALITALTYYKLEVFGS